jgi:hypothetical protein
MRFNKQLIVLDEVQTEHTETMYNQVWRATVASMQANRVDLGPILDAVQQREWNDNQNYNKI